MAELITATDLSVSPDYRMFGIGDADPLSERDAPVPAPGWLGVGRTAVLVGVGEQLVHPAVRLEHWDGPPPSGPGDHEVQETIRLHAPTGRLHLNEITGGFVHDIFEIPPGVYSVRITGWERESTRRAFENLRDRTSDWNDPEYEAGRAALHGRERYLFQFWLEAPTARLLHSEGLVVHAGRERLGIVDSAREGSAPIPAAGPDRLTVDQSCLLVRIARPEEQSVLRLSLWDGPPPVPETEHTVLGVVRMRVLSARLYLLRLPLEETDAREIWGRIPFGHGVPPGDYNVRVSEGQDRYFAQFWSAV